MIRHPFNGSIEDRRIRTGKLHYQGTVVIVEDKKEGQFHASYSIHLHDGRGNRTSEDRHVTVVGEFATERDALHTALEHAGKYFR